MSKPVIFLYSDDSDVFVQKVSSFHSSNPAIRLMKFEQLVRDLSPSDWPVVVGGRHSEQLRDAFEAADVVNRVFNIDPDIVQSGLLRCGPHELWLHVIVQPLLNSAASLTHDFGTRGVSRSLLPLNTQWMLMSESGRNDIRVPRFVLGFGGADPDVSGLRDPMQKSIWSYFDWKVENHLPKAEAGWHKFFVERPAGVPVICHYLGDNAWCTFPRGQRCGLDQRMLSKVVARASKCFMSTIGEVLVFVEDDGAIRFHAFSPHMTAAVDSSEFESQLAVWLADLCGGKQQARSQEEPALA